MASLFVLLLWVLERARRDMSLAMPDGDIVGGDTAGSTVAAIVVAIKRVGGGPSLHNNPCFKVNEGPERVVGLLLCCLCLVGGVPCFLGGKVGILHLAVHDGPLPLLFLAEFVQEPRAPIDVGVPLLVVGCLGCRLDGAWFVRIRLSWGLGARGGCGQGRGSWGDCC